MTLKEQIMKLQTYKMFEGEDTVYVERDDVLKTLEQQPSEEAILKWKKDFKGYVDFLDLPRDDYKGIVEYIDELPPVTPQPKTGHWIATNDYVITAYGSLDYYRCSCCGEVSLEEGDYCPNCGADMRESEE